MSTRGNPSGRAAGAARERAAASPAPSAGGYRVERRGDVDANAGALFGRAVDDATLARLAGALPGARVTVSALPRGGLMLQVDGAGHAYDAWRAVDRDARGLVNMLDWQVQVAAGARAAGLGLRMLATEVKAASSLGVRYLRIEAAARGDARGTIGYSYWFDRGYDAAIPPGVRARMPAAYAGAARFSDLYALPGGRAWWREHGDTVHDISFDLAPGSYSRSRLEQALRDHNIRWSDI